MAWLMLIVAGLAETGWAIGLKYTQGFTRLTPSLVTVLLMGISFGLLAQALRTLPLGTAYAVWVGIGACGTLILGIFLFEESRDPIRIGCIALIVVGIVGLRLVDAPPPDQPQPPDPPRFDHAQAQATSTNGSTPKEVGDS